MLDKSHIKEELILLIGEDKYGIWLLLCEMIDSIYDMEQIWSKGGKAWDYEYKYRRGGKTLCALYARPNCVGFMIIFGKDEREKFEICRENFSAKIQQIYDEAKTYHDGKWMMFDIESADYFDDFKRLLSIKRKSNRK